MQSLDYMSNDYRGSNGEHTSDARTRSGSGARQQEQLSLQIQAIRARVRALYRRGDRANQTDSVLMAAFEELAIALELLERAEEQRNAQLEEWLNERAQLESTCRRYQELFAEAPEAYFVTRLDGTIRLCNHQAVTLLQATQKVLTGRSLAYFIPEGRRRAFRAAITDLLETTTAQSWELLLQPWNGPPYVAHATVGVSRNRAGQAHELHWHIR
jgi:PAS domain S-box-containing protein